MHKTTYLLLVLIVITFSFSLLPQNYFLVEAQAGSQKDARVERYQQARGPFPIVDYDEPNLPDTEDNRAKKEKKKRFNALGNWVFASTRPYYSAHISSASYFNFPALPVAKSDIILIGVVSETEAHLSENKRNVFSECMVLVETVLKTSDQTLKQRSVMTVDRMGGFVRYPGGHTVLYQRAAMYMPKIGGRYLFFLNSITTHDYGILTAYKLTNAGVTPLDEATQFFVWEGKSETEIMEALRGLLLNNSN